MVVTVLRKLPVEEIEPNQILPRIAGGVPVDVVMVTPLETLSAGATTPAVPKRPLRPEDPLPSQQQSGARAPRATSLSYRVSVTTAIATNS